MAGFNVHTIALQVPITDLTRDHKADRRQRRTPSIGVYASASRQRTTVLRETATTFTFGDWVQVSRLGEPLINEVIIPLGRKDRWNRSDPRGRQAVRAVLPQARAGRPGQPALSGPARRARRPNRDDLVTVLLTGSGRQLLAAITKSDLLRLNMAIPPSRPTRQTAWALSPATLAGFPNGRRLADDVVDIELRAVACGYGDFLAAHLRTCATSPRTT